jgi:F0F1-type ATP synthase membrane subunit a
MLYDSSFPTKPPMLFLTFQKKLTSSPSASLNLGFQISKHAILMIAFFKFQKKGLIPFHIHITQFAKVKFFITIKFYNTLKLKFVKVLSFMRN